MPPQDFDELAKALASRSLSRRDALRWLGAALFGGAVASIPGVAFAKPKPGKCTKDEQCPAGQGCVDGQCVYPSGTCVPGDLQLPQSCSPGGTCVCPTGFSCNSSGFRSYCQSNTACNGTAGCALGETCCPGDPSIGNYACCHEGEKCVGRGTNVVNCR